MFSKIFKGFLFGLTSFLFVTGCEYTEKVKEPIKVNFYPKVAWEKVYKEVDYQKGIAIVPAKSEKYLILGATGKFRSPWVLKIDKKGNLILRKSYFDDKMEEPSNIIPLKDQYLITGSFLGTWFFDTILRWIDDNLNLLDMKIIIRDDLNAAGNGVPTPDGGVIVIGQVLSNTTAEDIWIFKMDANKKIVWEKTIGNEQNDGAPSITRSRDGNYLIAGWTNRKITNYDGWIIKINEYGKIIWEKTIGGNEYEEIYKLIPAWDGGYIGVGHKYKDKKSEMNIWLVKINENGEKIWEKVIDFKENWNDMVVDIEQTFDGNYIIAGNSFNRDPKNPTRLGYVIKIDRKGKVLWRKSVYGEKHPYIKDILPIGYLEYFVLGTIYTDKNYSYDIWLMKLEEDIVKK